MIKAAFLVSALVASALAEADAYDGYSHINAVPVHHAVSYSTPVHHAVSYAAPAVHHAVSYPAAPVHHAVSSYAAPVVHHPVGYGVLNVASTVGIHGAAPAAIPAVAGAYAGAGRYVANSAGTVHVAKREAEADAYTLGYSSYGYRHGYRLYSLGYAHHLGYSNYGYSYPAYTYGKRSADPQTTVEATLTTIKL